MKQEVIIALCDSIVKKYLEDNPVKSTRGPRGLKGAKGDSFDFDSYEKEINSIIKKEINERLEDLKLKFSDLSEDDLVSLKLSIDDLTDEERLSLKGPRGQRGKNGSSFNFEKEKDSITLIIQSYISEISSSFKLSFSDLSDLEKESLKGEKGLKGERGLTGKTGKTGLAGKDGLNGKDGKDGEVGPVGPRGIRGEKGKAGRDFVLDEHKVEIDNTIIDYFEKIKSQLKLNFSDLTIENKEELKLKYENLTDEQKSELRGPKGPRGQKGAKGSQGLSVYDIWKELNEGEEKDFLLSLVGPRGIDGLDGLNGKDGRDGFNGKDGKDGNSAPFVIDVKATNYKNNDFSLTFEYSDGTVIKTNRIKLPVSTIINQMIASSGGGGGGLSAITVEQDGVEIGPAKILDFSEDFSLSYDSVNERVTIVHDSKIEVLDEGILVSDQVKKINFVGDTVFVRKNNSIANWESLSDIMALDEIIEDPSIVDVVVSAEAPANETSVSPNSSRVIDRISLNEFVFATYTITIYNVSNSVGRSFQMTVNNYGGTLIDQVYGISGSGIDYAIDSVSSGGFYELRITNNESYELSVSFKNKSF